MQLYLKRAWAFLKNPENNDFNSEFQNIRQWWNDHDSGIRAWTNFSSQGSASFGTNKVTAAYTLGGSDFLVLADTTSGAFTVTLPDATVIQGRQYTIFNVGTHLLTVTTTSAQTINGNATTTVPANYFCIQVFSDGANWVAR